MAKFSNTFMSFVLHSPLHGIFSRGMMVLTYKGRKTGRQISVPIGYYVQPDGSLLTTSLRSRTWWRNLRDGAPVALYIKGQLHKAYGEAFEAPLEVMKGLDDLFRQQPRLARYFGIQLGVDGLADTASLHRVAKERVIVRFQLADQTRQS
jgi:hypothetical protein